MQSVLMDTFMETLLLCGPLKNILYLSIYLFIFTAKRGRRRISKTWQLWGGVEFIWVGEVWRSQHLPRYISVWVTNRDEKEEGSEECIGKKEKRHAMSIGVTGLIPIEISYFVGSIADEPELCFLSGDISLWIWKTSVCVCGYCRQYLFPNCIVMQYRYRLKCRVAPSINGPGFEDAQNLTKVFALTMWSQQGHDGQRPAMSNVFWWSFWNCKYRRLKAKIMYCSG